MDTEAILAEYDSMYGSCSMEQIYEYLEGKLTQAFSGQEWSVALTLLNEMMGLCRETSKSAEGLKYCELTLKLLDKMGLNDTVDYATSLLNVANAFRAFGEYERSQQAFARVEQIYRQNEVEDILYAGLYNNQALLYQETGDYTAAKEKLLSSLKIIDGCKDEKIKQAITRSNLGVTLLRISEQQEDENAYEEAVQYITKALEIFSDEGGNDYHYNGALAAMGDAMYMKEKFDRAVFYYDAALKELEKHVGRNEGYYRVKSNYNMALEKFYRSDKKNPGMGINMKRCLAFYEEYGKQLIEEKYAEYADRIAVGLVGEGSDCFEYDDSISMDHDYGIGFCMWLTDEDYDEIGAALQADYLALTEQYEKESPFAGGAAKLYVDKRRGVMRISSFYRKYAGDELYELITKGDGFAGLSSMADRKQLLLEIPTKNLAAATNGRVFKDVSGIFSGIRDALLSFYPDNVRNIMIAKELYNFSQNAQSNYPRMMARKDYVTAHICIAQASLAFMRLEYLFNKTFCPYYKWLFKGLDRFPDMTEAKRLINELALLPNQSQAWQEGSYSPYEINYKDRAVYLFEQLAKIVAGHLDSLKIVKGEEFFLDRSSREIFAMEARNDLIDEIIKAEWEQFDKVVNEGGRAACQDDWSTFSIMRRSQYLTWNDELLESYYHDICVAKAQNRNLISEKYARMMESTAPEEYAEFADKLPKISEDRLAIQETIIAIQVGWMEEFAGQYPKMAANARSIHTAEDSAFNTSYETYLRGEISTYSEKTFVLYGRFIANLQKNAENLAYMIMDNTAKLYGYESAENAEKKLANQADS